MTFKTTTAVDPAPHNVVITPPTTVIEKTKDTGEVADSNGSKSHLASVEELLSRSNPGGGRYFKYVVDRASLAGFREDMPVLRIVFPEQVFFDTDK